MTTSRCPRSFAPALALALAALTAAPLVLSAAAAAAPGPGSRDRAAAPAALAARPGVLAHDRALDPFRDARLDAPEVHALRQRWLRARADPPDVRPAEKADLPAWAQGDWLHLDIELTLDPSSGHVTTRTMVPVRALGATDSASFYVAPIQLDSVVVRSPDGGAGVAKDGVARTVTATYDEASWLLRVQFEPGLVAGEEVLLEVAMSGVFACDTQEWLPSCGFSEPLSFATGLQFFPTPAQTELTTADLTITVPDGYVAAANGELTAETSADGFTSYRFERPYPGRYVVWAVSDYVRSEALAGDVPLVMYTFPAESGGATTLLGETADVVDFYAQNYAPYPYGQLAVVEMARDFGGGFGPLQAIFMSGGVFRATPDSRHWAAFVQLQSHEIAHQWWGNFIGIGDNESVVISEGMAEFSSAWHYEVRKGSRSNFVTNAYSYLYTVPRENDQPVASANVYYSSWYTQLVYEKGSVIMDMLRWELGDEAFGALLHELFARRGGGFLTVRELGEIASEVAGDDLSWFFEQWYEQPGFPLVDVRVRQQQRATDDWTITLLFTQPSGRPFRFTLPVHWRGADGALREEQVLVDSESVEYVIEADGPAVTIAPDPAHHVLQITRSVDVHDVNLTGDVDAFDLLDLSARFGTAIIADWNGQQYFWPDPRYESRFDVDRDGRIDAVDRDSLLGQLTWTSVAPDATPDATDDAAR